MNSKSIFYKCCILKLDLVNYVIGLRNYIRGSLEMSALLSIGPGPTIDHILLHMQEKYPPDIVTTFVFVWANKDFPQSSKEILDNSEYLHLRSNGYIDFFFPGYLIKEDIDTSKDEWKISHSWEFDTEEFVRAIKYIEGISRWRYSGDTEFLFLEYSSGRIRFQNSISLNTDYLLKDNVIPSLPSLIEDIIRTAKSYNRVSDFSRELNCLEAKKSTMNAIKKYISVKLHGAYTGTYKCKNLEL